MNDDTAVNAKNVTVIGIGAMGGGMARALLKSDAAAAKCVVGYDLSPELVKQFYEEAKAVGKEGNNPPPPYSSLKDAVTSETEAVILVLVNENQCEAVCFGGKDGNNLSSLLTKTGATVILCSTVKATWARSAKERFLSKNIHFVDSPISGGPARALQGDLTMMASGDDEDLQRVMPILNALGREVHVIPGGVGMGSTAKMVHQLLAGVHICAAAEALALAAKAGIDVEQMYNIVMGAAGASWMMGDRGKRMMSPRGGEVKSALDIFVKDLDIVHSEAKALQSPIPLASTTLQQFVSGQSLGLGKMDDSSVVKVYENVTGVPVAKTKTEEAAAPPRQGDEVGDFWKMEDGTWEEIVEVGNEPRHGLQIRNEYTRVLRVSFPPQDTTLAHRHDQDSLYFFLTRGGLQVVNHVKGAAPICDCMDFGEIRFGTHKTDRPLIHKITNRTNQTMLCVDAEVLKRPPVTSALPLVAQYHSLVKDRPKCRVYQLSLPPGVETTVSYPFYHLTVVLVGGMLEKRLVTSSGSSGGGVSWTMEMAVGDVQWSEPCLEVTLKNVGTANYEAYIAEWR